MRYDVKKEINQVVQDKTLSKQEKIQKIKDIYNSANSGGVTGADTKDAGGAGNSASGGNSGNGQNDDQNQNGQGQGQGQNQGNGQQGQNGQGQGQNGQGQGQGQGQNGQNNNNGVHNVSHNQLKNQGVGQNGQQNGNQQNGNGSQGNQGNQSGNQGQNGSNGGQNGQQGNQSGNQGSNGGSQSGQQGNQSGNQQNGGGSQGSQGNQQNGQGGSQSQGQQGGQQGQSGNQNGQGGGSQGQQGQGNQQQGQGQGNSQSQNQNGQHGQGNQQQQGSQENASQIDEYSIGYILGKKYAEEMYKHRGLAPVMRDQVELPDNLDPMKILESLNESIDDDIAALLDDTSINDDERTSKIHDLFRNTIKGSGNKQQDPEEKEIYVPDDVIVMRNGTVDPGELMIGAHVIDEKIGDEIRKEMGVTPKDPDWGMSDDEDAMIKEAFPIIGDIFKHAPQDDKELVSAAETMKNKIEGRIRKSREGIIDWKKALQDFISERSHTYEKGPLRKNVYQRTGIGLKHRVKAFNDFNKCVVYIDTSGSVNNGMTQLIPIMAGEVGKIMQDCHFNTVDIHLFDDVVYNEHFDVDSYTVQDENWGIEGADDGGGTNIHEVYKHIIKNYMNDGELNYDINAIIIITDVSGMQYSGNIKPFAAKLGQHTLERMLYVIYNDYANMYLKEVTAEMDQLVSKYSQHYEISVEAFRKQILSESMNINQKRMNMNEALGSLKKIPPQQQQGQTQQQQGQIDPSEEWKKEFASQAAETMKKIEDRIRKSRGIIDLKSESMNINQKRMNMNEALGGLKKIQQKQQQAQIDPSERTEDEKNERLRKAEIQGARAVGQLEKVLPELVANLEKFFPNCNMVKEYTAVMATPNTYYVTEEAHVILHMDVDGSNINNLCEACSVMTIDQLIGNVKLKNTRTFRGFPVGFPKEIGGDLVMFNLANLGGFDNAPQAVTGRVSINVCYPMNKHISKDAQNKYVTSLMKTLTPISELENKPKHVFTMTKRNNESVADIIKNRIALSESFINEMAMPKKLSTIFPRRSKPQAGSKVSEDDYIASTELYKKNRNVFFDVIDPILNVGWGDIKDDDVTVITDISQVRLAARETKYFEKHKDNINQLGYAGIRLFTTSDDVISAVYAQDKKGKDAKIVFLTDSDGNPITDQEKIKQEIDFRYNVLKQTYTYLDSLGIDPGNIPDAKYHEDDKNGPASIEDTALHILYFVMATLRGLTVEDKYHFKVENILEPNLIRNCSDNDEIFAKLLNDMFGSYREKGDSVIVYTRNRKYTIPFKQNGKSPNYNAKTEFNGAYFSSNNGQNVFTFFSDNFIKALLIGSSLRGVDDKPRYTIDEIIDADRSELLNMIDSIKDVDNVKTALKSLSFKGKDKDTDDNYDHSNPFDVLMMFPDKCEKEYDIRVDVNDEALKLVGKKVLRDIYKSGMYNDIKNYDYDRATGERTRNDIKGASSSKKIADQNDIFASFSGCIDYILANKLIFNDVKNALKNAIDEYTNAHSWYSNKTLLSKIDDSVDILYNYSNLIKSKLINNEDLITKKQDVIEKMVETLNDVIDHIEFIVNPENDYKAIVDEGEKLVKSAMRFGEEYKILAGESDEAANITAKKMKKLGERNRSKKASNVSAQQDNGEDAKTEQTKTKFAQVIDDLSGDIVKVNDAMKNLDFAGASEDAVDHFATKEDMIRRIRNQLNKVIEIANTIKTNGAIDWMNITLPLLNDVFYTCSSVINANNEENMTDFLVDLDGACRAVAKAARRFASQQTYKQTGATVA